MVALVTAHVPRNVGLDMMTSSAETEVRGCNNRETSSTSIKAVSARGVDTYCPPHPLPHSTPSWPNGTTLPATVVCAATVIRKRELGGLAGWEGAGTGSDAALTLLWGYAAVQTLGQDSARHQWHFISDINFSLAALALRVFWVASLYLPPTLFILWCAGWRLHHVAARSRVCVGEYYVMLQQDHVCGYGWMLQQDFVGVWGGLGEDYVISCCTRIVCGSVIPSRGRTWWHLTRHNWCFDKSKGFEK